jgi:hypothetical protein
MTARLTHGSKGRCGQSILTKDFMNAVADLPVQGPSLGLLSAEPLRAAMEFARHKLAKIDASNPDWGQGFNTGPEGNFDTWLKTLKGRVAHLLSSRDQPATFIGWSLGGLYARELGKLMAPRLRQVITIGTPFNADAVHSHVGWLFRLLSGNSTAIDPALSQRLRTPPPVPTTSIYSRSDGVVAWQTCLHDKPFMRVHDVEAAGSQIGMGWNPDVLDTVSNQLGRRPGSLRRHVAS